MARTKSASAEISADEKITKTAAAADAKAERANETEAKASVSAAEKQTDERLIYVGADLQGMKANTVFTGKAPKVLDVDFVRELVIPVDKLTEFLKKKAVTTSREAFCWRKSEYARTLKK